MKSSIDIPIKDIVKMARTANRGFFDLAKLKWDKEINAFWKKNKNKRHFWIWDLKWKNIHEVELYHGKPKKGESGRYPTFYGQCFKNTRQSVLYYDIITLYDNNPDAVITLSISNYNTLMTYNADESE